MKYTFRFFVSFGLLTCIPFLLSSLTAQQMPKYYPTLELFTNTPCPICGSQNPAMFDRLENYAGEYHLISFYPGTPYSSCIFYQANQSGNSARLGFYPQVFGTPTVVINGDESVSSSGITTTAMNELTGGESWLQVRVEETTGANRDVTTTLEDFTGNTGGAGLLYAVIVEREIMYNAPNGEDIHHNVFREFLTPTMGDPVNLASGSDVKTYQYDVDMDWQADETYVIAWMTSNESKEIINSGTRFDEVLSSTDDLQIKEDRISVFPNPASSMLNITIPASLQAGVLRIHGLSGNTLQEIEVSSGQDFVQINTMNLDPGSYLVEVKSGNRSDVQFLQVIR